MYTFLGLTNLTQRGKMYSDGITGPANIADTEQKTHQNSPSTTFILGAEVEILGGRISRRPALIATLAKGINSSKKPTCD